MKYRKKWIQLLQNLNNSNENGGGSDGSKLKVKEEEEEEGDDAYDKEERKVKKVRRILSMVLETEDDMMFVVIMMKFWRIMKTVALGGREYKRHNRCEG